MNLVPERLRGELFDAPAFERALAQAPAPLAPFRANLVYGRSYLIDRLLERAWSLHVPPQADAALVAVGGYGRGELHPGSDIDLMILLGEQDTALLHDPIESLVTFLWDIGLEVGHSVRTLEQCAREAEQTGAGGTSQPVTVTGLVVVSVISSSITNPST